MSLRLHHIYGLMALLIVLCCCAQSAVAQFKMSNQKVFICQGTLSDSDNGRPPNPPDNYDHNENYTFTICVPGSQKITMNFTGNFCTETLLDYLRFYDGPDTLSPRIGGYYSGSNSPGTIIAYSGCLTVNFISDANISCSGWTSNWTVIPPTPVAPKIAPFNNPVPCGSQYVDIFLDKRVPCSTLAANQFSMAGPAAPAITSVQGINCTNDSTQTVRLHFAAPGITESGTYNIVYNYKYVDLCQRVFNFSIPVSFIVNDCPIKVKIIPDNNDSTLCYGSCKNLTPNVRGGNGNYVYQWSTGSSSKIIKVCPTVNTTYIVTVDDNGPAQPGSAQVVIRVLPLPDAGPHRKLCENANPLKLSGTPSGGYWTGPGMDADGTFTPYKAGSGSKIVTYIGPNGCSDTTLVDVLPISAGWNEAACTGSAPFTLSGSRPPDGTWSGTGITNPTTGTFNPSTTGTFTVTYAATNGCAATKQVVVDALQIEPDKKVCINSAKFNLNFKPIGGFWSGQGITNNYWGEFTPAIAGAGVHQLTYQVQGCPKGTINITVQDVKAGNDTVICPMQNAFNFTKGNPSGGIWSGMGITDGNTGAFNPGVNGGNNFTTPIIYTINGCRDTLIVNAVKTVVNNQTTFFCPTDSAFALIPANTMETPTGGVWSGVGVTNNPPEFRPAKAKTGQFQLQYTANTCSALLVVHVYDSVRTQPDTSIYSCPLAPNIKLRATPTGGIWRGTGIVDSTQGAFSPVAAGNGTVHLAYRSPDGCWDSLLIHVQQLASVKLLGAVPTYCYKDTNYSLSGTPNGGYLSLDSVTNVIQSFNPKKAGTGQHILYYTFGPGACAITDHDTVWVRKPIKPILPFKDTTLCYGDSVYIKTSATGGNASNGYQYQWKNFPSGSLIVVKPTLPYNKYVVEVNDHQCSEPGMDSLAVRVHPQMLTTVTVGDTVCFGQKSWAKIKTQTPGTVSYYWNTKPTATTDSVYTTAGKYNVRVTNDSTHCVINVPVRIPYFSYIEAHIAYSPPGQACVSILNPTFDFIDLSLGGQTGVWHLGDGDTISYTPAQAFQHTYRDTGHYTVALYMQNPGGCTMSDTVHVCVRNDHSVYIPTIFTPNGDGLNDTFEPKGVGIAYYEMDIMDRWGNDVYNTSVVHPWDGKIRNTNNDAPIDVYVYKMKVYYTDKTFSKHIGSIALVR